MAGSTKRTSARSRSKSSDDVDEDDPLVNRKPISRNKKPGTRDNNNNSSIKILKVNLRYLLLFGVFACLVFIFMIYYLLTHVEEVQKLSVITPFPAPKIMDLPQFQGDHKESLYWGTYRPHVYLGIRARTPRSLIAGLMWIGVKDGRYVMRHICQDSDELSSYGWTHHNGRDYGHQIIVDHDMTLTTSFLKSKGDGSGYGGDWSIRVDMQTDKYIPDLRNFLFKIRM